MAALGSRCPRESKCQCRWLQWRRQRYAILRDIGCFSASEAAAACPSPPRFAEAMRARGHDPEKEWPDLSRRNPGGWPRGTSEKNRIYTARYRELKALGGNAAFCSYHASGPGVFEKGKRELRRRITNAVYS